MFRENLTVYELLEPSAWHSQANIGDFSSAEAATHKYQYGGNEIACEQRDRGVVNDTLSTFLLSKLC